MQTLYSVLGISHCQRWHMRIRQPDWSILWLKIWFSSWFGLAFINTWEVFIYFFKPSFWFHSLLRANFGELAWWHIWHGGTSGMVAHLAWRHIWHGGTSGTVGMFRRTGLWCRYFITYFIFVRECGVMGGLSMEWEWQLDGSTNWTKISLTADVADDHQDEHSYIMDYLENCNK